MTSHKRCGWRAQLSFISAPLGFDTDEGVGADEKGKKGTKGADNNIRGFEFESQPPKKLHREAV